MNKRNVAVFGAKFIGGGSAYGALEVLWRGFTHISMIILGGICFIGLLHVSQYKLNLLAKSVVGGSMITAAELLAGLLLNVWLNLGVWDYSGERFQILGQICLKYFFLWCGLSFLVFAVCRLTSVFIKTKQQTAAS